MRAETETERERPGDLYPDVSLRGKHRDPTASGPQPQGRGPPTPDPASFPPPPHSEPRPSRPGRRGAKRGGRGAARGRLVRGATGAAPGPGNPWSGRVAPEEGGGGGGGWGRGGGLPAPPRPTKVPSVQPAAGEVPAPGSTSLGAAEPSRAPAARSAAVPGGPMPRCPTGAMDEGPVDLRTRPKAAGLPGAALPLRKRPLRAPSPEPAAPRCAAGPLATPEPVLGGSNGPAAPASRHGLARPEALYYQGECLPPVKVGLGATQGIGSPEAGHIAQTQVQGVPGSWGDRGRSQGPKTQIWGSWDAGGGRPRSLGYRHGSSAWGQSYMGVPGSWVQGA